MVSKQRIRRFLGVLKSMNTQVLIVGGGIAGPALSLFLNEAGIASTIYEAYPRMEDIGGGFQIAPNGMRVLEQLALTQKVIAEGVESDEFLFENQHGKMLGSVPNGPASLYGIPAVLVRRSFVHQALLDEVERSGILIHYQKRLLRLESTATSVLAHFEDGSSAEGELLIGADGVQSRTRGVIFPNGPRPFYTGLFTIGGFSSDPILIPKDEREMHRMHMVYGREGFFGYAHFDRQRPDSVMWWTHLSKDEDPESLNYKSWSTDQLRREMLSRHEGWTTPVRAILKSAPELLRGPVFDVPILPAWSKGRVLLIGDAAHATSPHAGLGASLALEDAMLLAKLMRRSHFNHDEVFAQFEQGRRQRVERVITESRRRGEKKRVLTPTAAWIRDRMISAFSLLLGSRMNRWMYDYKIAWED